MGKIGRKRIDPDPGWFMCELLGLNSNYPVASAFSFRGFQHRREKNIQGWGLARDDGQACLIFIGFGG